MKIESSGAVAKPRPPHRMRKGISVVVAALALAAPVVALGAGADDTGRNVRDRDASAVTADQQSNRKEDVQITRAIRRAVVKDQTLSTNARNVKIVTQDGAVTLRGPVDSKLEKETIVEKAKKVRHVKSVDDQLEIAKP